MKNLLLLVLVPSLSLASSGADSKPATAAPSSDECHHGPVAADAKPQAGWVLTRGEKIKGSKSLTLAELLTKSDSLSGQTVLVEGQVRKACQRKGCWMELAADDKGPGVRVTFKDYGFFVPLDSAGSKARVEGTVQVAELSEERAKHYESEGATVPRGKDGKPREVQLVASGVELRK